MAGVVGDIKTARIVIEDGAYFKGSIDIVKSEPKTAPQQAVPPAPRLQTAGGPVTMPVVAQAAGAADAKR